MTKKGNFSIIIPVYNHEDRIAHVVDSAKKLGLPIIVVDDGSTDSSYDNIKDSKGITVLRHEKNMGKGAAIITGFIEASKKSNWAITIDADGQHDPGDAVKLMEAIPENLSNELFARPIVVGKREDMVGPDVPWTSRFGRGFSNFWVWTSGGPLISDSQSGFRVYPVPDVLKLKIKSMRFQFEVEVLAKARWKKISIVEAPISVTYSPGMERVSHFRPFVDFMRNSRTFMRLIFQRIFIPAIIRRKF